MVGVYYYSTATSITEAQKEAKFVLSTLDDRELDLPVVYDFEMPSGSRIDFRLQRLEFQHPEDEGSL